MRVTMVLSAFLLACAASAHADIPLLNAICPGRIEVDADQGGPIYINGGATISLAINPDGTPLISYTGNGARMVCAASRGHEVPTTELSSDQCNCLAHADIILYLFRS